MVWEQAKAALRTVLPDNTFSLWIEPLEVEERDEEKLVLACPDRYFGAYVTRHYLDMIAAKVSECDDSIKTVCLSHNGCCQGPHRQPSQLRLPSLPENTSAVRALHPRYTFTDFMVGQSNILAQSACRSMATLDDSIGPCLYINSSTGLGKTHLTHAIAHQVLDSRPMTRLYYLTAQQFAAEMVVNIKAGAMEEFKRKYQQQCDILLVEDLQSLTGKKKTQEELDEVLDTLIKSGKRVVMTANTTPQELAGIDDAFRSRMSAGLITSIHLPDLDTRRRIIRRKAEQQALDLPDEFVEYLAKHVIGDVRRMESTILALAARAAVNGGIDANMVEEVTRFLTDSSRQVTPRAIGELVGRQFNLSLAELRSRSRKKSIAFPRQVAMYLCRKHTEETLAEIGRCFSRDHSTVMHAIKVVSGLSRRDNAVSAQLRLLSDKVRHL